MTTAVQHRRGTTAEHSTFTGLEGEVTIDTTKDTAVIHDGVLAGGYPLAKENLANVTTSGLSSIDGASTASDDKFFIYDQSATTLKTITRAELNNAIEQDALANVAITGGTINGTTIGGTTPAAGAFTTLSSTGNTTLGDAVGDTVTVNGTATFANANPTLSAGTANGVAYLNGSKVLTTGSALTFDGSMLQVKTPSATGTEVAARFASSTNVAGVKVERAGASWRLASQANLYLGADYDADSTGSDSNIIFEVDATEGMRLTSTGLGIGTSSPSEKLAVNGRMIALATGSGYTVNPAGGVFGYYSAGTPTTYVQAPASGQIQFWGPSTSAWATLDSSGNLGIGTSSPGSLTAGGNNLVVGGGSGNTGMSIYSGTTGVGAIYFADGTTGADAYRGWFEYKHNTNSFSIGTNGSERAVLDSSGNLGIGTSSPWSQLTVGSGGTSNPASTVTFHKSTASEYRLKLTSSTFNADGTWLGLGFGYSDNYMKAAIIAEAKDGNARANMHFALNDAASSANAGLSDSKMVLTYSGNLGIGTSSPAYKVDSSGQVRALESGTGSGDGGFVASTSGANGNAGVLFQTNSASRWNLTTAGTNGANLRIYNYALASTVATFDSSGNLGLGVTPSAGVKLQMANGELAGWAGTSGYLVSNTYYGSGDFRYVGTGAAARYQQVGGVHAWLTAPSGTAGNAISFTQAMTLGASGNLGVGTTSPGARVEIAQSIAGGNGVGLILNDIGSSGGAEGMHIQWRSGTDKQSDQCRIGQISNVTGSGSNLCFYTNPADTGTASERARIDSSGNVGIGTSSPTSKLTIGTGSYALAASGTTGMYTVAAGLEMLSDSYFFGTRSGGTLMSVSSSGDLTISGSTATKASGTAWANPSDIRLKKNIKAYNKGLKELLQIQVKTWEYNGKGGTTTGARGLGVIADEAMLIIPQSVDTYSAKLNDDDEENTDIKRFDATEITWLLVKAIQEQQAIIDSLKARLDAANL